MSLPVRIKSAFISVYYKDNLLPIVQALHKQNVVIYSTGGTRDFIKNAGIPVVAAEDLTNYPAILGGRVKTLHPKIFGGILGRRDVDSDKNEMQQFDIPNIDLVIVDLYPFEETLNLGATEAEIIEKIDIGGVSLLRAAAKNHKHVTVISSDKLYPTFLDIFVNKDACTDFEDRRFFALEAFKTTSHYDTVIFNYFNQDDKSVYKQSFNSAKVLRYGENPHQNGIFYGELDKLFTQLNGKDLSYNNLLDIDAAVNLMEEFSETTFAILKHNNACGIASREVLKDAWKDALAADPVSAFGGVLIANTSIDLETAKEINNLFFEVLIAPAYNTEALDLLKSKPNRIILLKKDSKLSDVQIRTALNGILWQDKDLSTEGKNHMKVATNSIPHEHTLLELEFANKIVKHSKSNAIVLVKGKQMIGSGVGQTSRVDALSQAIHKAKNFGFDLHGAVMASDAFFPFSDCVEIAFKEGIHAIIQPGGSVRDKDSIDFCNQNGMAMVMTGVRHFKH